MSKIVYNEDCSLRIPPWFVAKFGRCIANETEMFSQWRHENVLRELDSVLAGVTARCQADHVNQKGSYVLLCSGFFVLDFKL